MGEEWKAPTLAMIFKVPFSWANSLFHLWRYLVGGVSWGCTWLTSHSCLEMQVRTFWNGDGEFRCHSGVGLVCIWFDNVFSGAFISWCSVLPCRVFECHSADQCREDSHHHHYTHPFAARSPGDQVRYDFGFFCYFQGEKVTPGGVMVLLFDSFSGSPWVAFIYIYIFFFFFSLALAGTPPNQSQNLRLNSKHPKQHRWGLCLFLPCWLCAFPSNFLKLFLLGIL